MKLLNIEDGFFERTLLGSGVDSMNRKYEIEIHHSR
jgi:hypothetical protein